MTGVSLAQPDITLLLDMSGVIREATVSSMLADESVDGWLGQSWDDTVPSVVGDKVRRIVEDARHSGISAFRQLTQRFPSGREVAIEYTTVLLGGRSGMLAVGKSLHAVAELQSRFVAAQQTLERDHWKLREVETRYRLLFNHSSEAVLLIREGSFRIVEANPAAIKALGISAGDDSGAGQDFIAAIRQNERAAVRMMIGRVQEQGKAPGTLVHIGEPALPWLLRASVIRGEAGSLLMLQLVPTASTVSARRPEQVLSVETVTEALPDGFVLLGRDGVIRRANQAFADMVDVGTAAAVVGEKLDRWVWRPGADVTALLATLREHGTARLFPSALHSELGTDLEVEISASKLSEDGQIAYVLLLRDVGRRLSLHRDPSQINSLIESVAEPVGKMPLRSLIKATVDGVERHYIKAALASAQGNRTAAAELLGLSRQSLYMKLGRYGLENEAQALPDQNNSVAEEP